MSGFVPWDYDDEDAYGYDPGDPEGELDDYDDWHEDDPTDPDCFVPEPEPRRTLRMRWWDLRDRLRWNSPGRCATCGRLCWRRGGDCVRCWIPF